MSNDVFTIIGSALTAQNARMGAIASNLANANSIAAPGAQPYRAHEIVFAAADAADGETDAPGADATGAALGDGPSDMGVTVLGSVESNAAPQVKYDPGSPYADASGDVTGSNVQPAAEMVNLIDSSSSYAASVAVLQQASRIDQQMLASFQVS